MTDITRVVLAVDSSQVRTATRDLDGMNKTTKSTTSTVAGLGKVLAGAFAAVGGAKLASELYKVNAEAQRLKASLITVTGSIGSANVAWAQMEAFARTTPYSLTQAIEGFTKMKALGLDPTTSSMTAFGNVAAAMGKDLTQMIEAVADASTSEFERLKEFGIKAKQEGDRVSLTFQGVTTQIGNNAKEITGYLEDIGNNQFGGAMARQMDTLGGATSNLGDNFDALMRTVGESGGNSGMIGVINGLSAAIVDFTNVISTNADEITDFIDQVVFYAKSAKLVLEEVTESTKDDPWYMLPVTRGPAGALYRYMGFGGKQEFEGDRDGITAGIAKIRAEMEDKKIERQLAANGVAAETWMAEQEKLNGVVDESCASVDKLTKKSKELADVIGKEVITEVEAAAKEFSKLRDELYPQQAAVRDLMHEYELFSTFAPGALDDWIDKLKVAPDELHRSAEAIDELTAKADPFGKIWDTTIERLQGSIADMFYDMLENGKVTFDNILDLFKRMAAEMAAQKLIMSFSGGGTSGAGGLFGGGSGGGGMNWSSLISMGKSLWSGISGLFGAGAASTATAGELFGTAGAGAGLTVDLGASSATTISSGISQGLSSVAAMWPAAVVAGMYMSGKLYDQGVRSSPSKVWESGSQNALSKIGNIGPTFTQGILEGVNNILEPLVGGKWAAILSGSTFSQALWTGINKALWGGEYETKDAGLVLGASGGGLDSQSFNYQKKKGGLFGKSKKKTLYGELDAELSGELSSLYDDTLSGVVDLFTGIGVDVTQAAIDGFSIASENISTKGKTEEEIQALVSEWFTKAQGAMVAAFGAGTGIEGLTTERLGSLVLGLGAVNQILTDVNVSLLGISPAGALAAEALIAVMGGMENMATVTGFYYQNFFTEQERAAKLVEQYTGVIGEFNTEFGAAVAGKADLRAFVESLDLTTEAGRNAYAAAMQLAPALVGLEQAVATLDAAAEAAAPAVEAISQAMLTLQSQTKALEIELLKAQGMDAAAQAAQYALDTEGLTAAEIAVYEYNQSIIAQIQAIEAATIAAESAAQAQAAEADRAANEALRIEEQKNAALEAAQQAAAQRAAAIAQERYGLESQLLQLQGNTAELRRRELKELDPSNRALQQQIWALEDQKTAAEAAAQASEELASTWGSIADNLLAEAQRIRDTATGDAMSFAGAQAQFAILTAQARAGNMDAAESLPGASQRLLELGMGQARTRADYIRLASATATSLEGTASTITSPDALAKRSAEALEKMQRDQADQLITIQQLTVTTNKMSRLWDDVTQGGTTIRTTETAA